MRKSIFHICILACVGTPFSQTLRTYYASLSPWNMTTEHIRYVNLPSYIPITSVVSASAVIFSDPDANGKRETVQFEQIAVNPMNSRWDGRGGVLQVELNGTTTRVKLEVTPTIAGSAGVAHPSRFMYPSFDGTYCSGSPKSMLERQLKKFTSTSTSVTPRRGYLKVSYLGNAPTHPFAIKSKVMTLDNWSMNNDTYPQEMWNAADRAWDATWTSNDTEIPFTAYGKLFPFLSNFGFSANRIAALEATIQSDLQDGATRSYSDFRRLRFGSGNSGPGWGYQDLGGGSYFVDEAKDKLIFNLACRNPDNGCAATFFQTLHDNPGNRGYITMDYVAGTCDGGGPSGYTIRAIPGTRNGTCSGTSQPFSIEGAGIGMGGGVSTDEFTYVYQSHPTQSLPNVANRTVSVKINSHNSSDFGQMAGVMIRATLAQNSVHASMIAKPNPNQRFSFRSRTTTGGTNNVAQTSGSIATAPSWLRVKKAGNVFTGYYHTSTSDVMPTSGWITMGSATINNFPSTYFIGLATSNYSSPNLGKVTYRSLTVTDP